MYDRVLQPASNDGDGSGETSSSQPIPVTEEPTHRRESLRFKLDSNLQGETELADVDYPSTISVQFLRGDGIPRVVMNVAITRENSGGVTVTLTGANVEAIRRKIDLPPARPAIVTRTARFVEIDFGGRESKFEFARATLLTAPLEFTDHKGKAKVNAKDNVLAWEDAGFADLFKGTVSPGSVSGVFTESLAGNIRRLPWTPTRLAVDGMFTCSFPVPAGQNYNAWAWLLTGNRTYGMIGVVYPDKLEETDSQIRAIILPVLPKAPGRGNNTGDNREDLSSKLADCNCDTDMLRVPVVVSETELANNPDVYTEDPGTSCKPFRNPERILSEKALFSVLRVEQPEISGSASAMIKNPILDFEQSLFVRNLPTARATANPARPFLASVSPAFRPPPWLGEIERLGSGRHEMNAQHPLQWEGDSLRYQATTVAKGHVLEFRMRTRSNGYSLGSVAKTLTLAPRQTKSRLAQAHCICGDANVLQRNSEDRMV